MYSHMKLRSHSTPSTTSTTSAGYQSSADQRPNTTPLLSDVASTLDEIKGMVDGLNATTEFEKSVKSVVALLVSQVKELKITHYKFEQSMLFRNKQVSEHMDELALSVVKSEQYTRRDAVTVVGVDMPTNETETDLTKKVVQALAKSGETVTASDLSVVHRNSKDNREVKGKKIPPSITVKFSKVSKKDSVLKNYKNFDSAAKKSRDVKIYQSLSGHYSSVRRYMLDFFNAGKDDRKFGPIFNPGIKVKWVTYCSPTTGLAFKLDSGAYFKGVHMWHEFLDIMFDNFPDCRV